MTTSSFTPTTLILTPSASHQESDLLEGSPSSHHQLHMCPSNHIHIGTQTHATGTCRLYRHRHTYQRSRTHRHIYSWALPTPIGQRACALTSVVRLPKRVFCAWVQDIPACDICREAPSDIPAFVFTYNAVPMEAPGFIISCEGWRLYGHGNTSTFTPHIG